MAGASVQARLTERVGNGGQLLLRGAPMGHTLELTVVTLPQIVSSMSLENTTPSPSDFPLGMYISPPCHFVGEWVLWMKNRGSVESNPTGLSS